jgi:lysophospholipase L1-like esterase
LLCLKPPDNTTLPSERVPYFPKLVTSWKRLQRILDPDNSSHLVPYSPKEISPALDNFIKLRSRISTQFRKNIRAQSISVIFLGDSLTEFFLTVGRSTWEQSVKPRGALNLGISALSSAQLITLLERGLFTGLTTPSLKVVVVLIGSTDLNGRLLTGNEIAGNIKTIIGLILEKVSSNCKIILMALLPADVPKATIKEGLLVNEIIKGYDDGKRVRFLDLSPFFGNKDGDIFQDLYLPDNAHLNSCGYHVWTEKMEPLLKELLDRKK